MARDRILVVDDNKLILKLIDAKLVESGFDVTTAGTAEEALTLLRAELPDLIVSDVMMPGIDGYDLCRRLKADPRTASIPVLMLTAAGDVKEKVRGFEAGADDYVVKPFEPAELSLRIRALLARARAARGQIEPLPPKGRVMSVFSLRGGVGKTTLAVNLAISLAQLWMTDVALVDLALETDQVAMMLNLRPRLTWEGLANAGIERLDEDLVCGHLVPHESGVHVLAAPTSPASATLITPKLVERVLELLRTRYSFVVVDLPASFAETNLLAFDASDPISLIMAPELTSLKASKTTLDVLASLGFASDRIAMVLNNTFPRKGLPQQRIEEALGVEMDLALPYEQTAFVDAINSGVPHVWSQPTDRTSLDIQKFAYKLSVGDMPDENQASASPILQRVRAALRR